MNVVVLQHLYERAPEIFCHPELVFHKIKPQNDRKKMEEDLILITKKNNVHAAIIDSKKFSPEFFEKLPTPFLLARFGIGVDNIPLSFCQKRNILVQTTQDSATISSAEHTMAILLALIKKVIPNDFSVKNGQWQRHMGIELHGKTLGILGLGHIGTEVARMATQGFKMRTLAWVRREKENIAPWIDEISDNIYDIAKKSDIVCCHLSVNEETEKIVDERFFAMMQPQSFFINNARGKLVDTHALYQALKNKKISGAGIDVFEEEPYNSAKENLHQLKNVILTPHIASHTFEANIRTAKKVVENILNYRQKIALNKNIRI